MNKSYFKARLQFNGIVGRDRKSKFHSVKFDKELPDNTLTDEILGWANAEMLKPKSISRPRIVIDYYESDGVFESWFCFDPKNKSYPLQKDN